MTNRANTVFVVLLMVLSAFVSGLYTAPNTTQNELNQNVTAPFFSGNNSSLNEWVQAWPMGSNFTSNSIINVTWSAGDLVTNITYNVTLDIYAHNTASNTSNIVYNYFTVFNATSNVSSGNWHIPNATLSAGCYYASVSLYDNNDGMHFDNHGFDLGIETDCNGDSGNNSGPMEWIEAWAESTNYTIEDIPIISWNASDLVTNITYNVTLDIYAHDVASNTNSVVWNDFTVFTASSNADAGWWNIPNGTLAVGCYYASVGLYDDNDGMHFDNHGFDLGIETDCSGDPDNNSGGNNTGNTTVDCGTLDTLTELMIGTDNTIYFAGDTVGVEFIASCTVLNKTYTLDYILYDSNNNTVSDNSANPWTWVANNVDEVHSMNFTLSADTYCLWTHLEDVSATQTVDSETHCFDVNEPAAAWGNGTARFIYIKPLAQSADQHTPFNLTFPAPPMANGSPYISNMICSKADGHNADVWETYVPLPFNNITSWKVENTYGIVMGMFVMHDAYFAGINSMETPTVIFEQNMSFSGHGPSELVDQAYFNCPMVTVLSTLSPVTTQNASVLSYVAGISVTNSGAWTGDLNWDVTTVTNGSSTALTDVAGHLIVGSSGALLDYIFNATGITANEICLNWELIDESGVELASGSECIAFTVIEVPEECTPWNNAECNTEFACPDGHLKVAVGATDNVTGAAIEIWDCILPGDEALPPAGSALPSIGVFGTLVASVFAVFIIARKHDEE